MFMSSMFILLFFYFADINEGVKKKGANYDINIKNKFIKSY